MNRFSAESSPVPLQPPIACVSEQYPEPSPLRHLLAIGGRWVNKPGGRRALLLESGASLLLHTRSGLVVELIHYICGEGEIAEEHINQLVQRLDQIGSKGSVLTNAWVRTISQWAMRYHPNAKVDIQFQDSCSAFSEPDDAIHEFREKMAMHSHGQNATIHTNSRSFVNQWDSVRQGMESFSQGLDQESLTLCRQLEMSCPQLYAYLQDRSSPTARRARHETIAMFPILASYIVSHDEVNAELLRMAIDLGESPIDAIVSTFGVSRDVVKSVAGRSALELGIVYDKQERIARHRNGPWGDTHFDLEPCMMLGSLAKAPVQQRPGSPTQWRVFQELAFRVGKDVDDNAWRIWTRNIERKAIPWLAKKGWPATIKIGPDQIDTDLALDELKDFLDAAVTALCCATEGAALAKRASDDAFDTVVGRFVARTGIRALLTMSHQWHQLYVAALRTKTIVQDARSNARAGRKLLEEPFQVSALSMVQLITQSEFLLESVEMEHCVASKFASALAGRELYFSVQTETGQRVSTFDLSIQRDRGACKVFLNQHSGFRNGRPSVEATTAVNEFCRHLRNGALADAAGRYLEGSESTESNQEYPDCVVDEDPAETVEQGARNSASCEVLRKHLPKLIESVVLQCEEDRAWALRRNTTYDPDSYNRGRAR